MAFLDEFARNVDMIATAVAERFDCAPDDLNTRVFAGAIIGASLAAINVGETNYRDVIAALELLEARPAPASPSPSQEAVRAHPEVGPALRCAAGWSWFAGLTRSGRA